MTHIYIVFLKNDQFLPPAAKLPFFEIQKIITKNSRQELTRGAKCATIKARKIKDCLRLFGAQAKREKKRDEKI